MALAEKKSTKCVQFNEDELQFFHAIKAAFDPKTMLNPGKNIPTLNRCAEMGAMHIHAIGNCLSQSWSASDRLS